MSSGSSPVLAASSLTDEASRPEESDPPGTAPAAALPAAGPAAASRPASDDWRWQMRQRLRSVAQLAEWFPDLAPRAGELARVVQTFPLAITPYYASLIRRADASDPIFALAVPRAEELLLSPHLAEDPLAEEEDSPVPGLVHRYPDRALFISTTTCASYCRYCTRKRVAGARESRVGRRRLQQAAEYLGAHPEIRDVVVSGGDPLTMATEHLEEILGRLRQVPSVEIIRLGTRTPAVLPQRITSELVEMLRRFHPLYINVHFNHPRELTAEAAEALGRLADAGIPLGNQSVLLRGVNDDPQVIAELCRGLTRLRVRPYYLYQCDLVRGVEHFRTPVGRGVEIMEYLRGRLSGLAIPTFVVDAPHGGGKIPVLPEYVVCRSAEFTVLRNFEGGFFSYPEPGAPARPAAGLTRGVWELAGGRAGCLPPAASGRLQRRRRGS